MTAWRIVLALAFAAGAPAAPAQIVPPPAGEILIERTVAIVGGLVVTQSDVDLAVTLALLAPDAAAAPGGASGAVIDRALMLHEVARFSPPDPDPAAVEARLSGVRVRAGGDAALAAVLTRAGFTPARLAAWVRDDLRITAYLEQRFAAAGAPVDADVAAYIEDHRADLARDGVSAEAMPTVARARLVAERRRDLISDWLADLRRRTDVVEFRTTPG